MGSSGCAESRSWRGNICREKGLQIVSLVFFHLSCKAFPAQTVGWATSDGLGIFVYNSSNLFFLIMIYGFVKWVVCLRTPCLLFFGLCVLLEIITWNSYDFK